MVKSNRGPPVTNCSTPGEGGIEMVTEQQRSARDNLFYTGRGGVEMIKEQRVGH
jgi:hypothetical protein